MNRRLLFAGLLLAFIPFTKPILLPVEAGGVLQNQWRNDVCLQCNGSTCGPASLATIFAYYGVKQTQRQIAAASFSCARGTESWYLVRYARKCGFHVRFVYDRQLSHIPAPAILGTGAERAGHFIVLLSAADGRVTIGDPLSGRAEMTEATFCTRYGFNGFAIAVGKERLP